MNAEYDVFEVLPNRSVRLRACVQGTRRALETLKDVGAQTYNECFATDLTTLEIIGRINERSTAQFNAHEYQSAAN